MLRAAVQPQIRKCEQNSETGWKGWGREPLNLNPFKLHTVKNGLNCVPLHGKTTSKFSGINKHVSTVNSIGGSSDHSDSDWSIISQRMNQTAPHLHSVLDRTNVGFNFVVTSSLCPITSAWLQFQDFFNIFMPGFEQCRLELMFNRFSVIEASFWTA